MLNQSRLKFIFSKIALKKLGNEKVEQHLLYLLYALFCASLWKKASDKRKKI